MMIEIGLSKVSSQEAFTWTLRVLSLSTLS